MNSKDVGKHCAIYAFVMSSVGETALRQACLVHALFVHVHISLGLDPFAVRADYINDPRTAKAIDACMAILSDVVANCTPKPVCRPLTGYRQP